MDLLIEGIDDLESQPSLSPRLTPTSTFSIDCAHNCDCFKSKINTPYDPRSSKPCNDCIDGLLDELDSVMSKLSSFQCRVEEEGLRLRLEIASPALRLLSDHLGESFFSTSRREISIRGAFSSPNPAHEEAVPSTSAPNILSSRELLRKMSSSSPIRRVVVREETTRSQTTATKVGTFHPSNVVMGSLATADIGRKALDGEAGLSVLHSPPRMSRLRQCYIDPSGNFRLCWDTIAFILILLLVVAVPFELTFLWDIETNATDSYPLLWWFAVFVDCFFLFDIVINCFTGFYSKGGRADLVKQPSKILRRYLRGWFWIDAISTFPFSRAVYILGFSSAPIRALQVIRATKLARILRVVRGVKLGGLVQMLETYMVATRGAMVAFHLLKLCLCMLISCHWAACFWYIIGYCSGQMGYMETWVQDFSDGSVKDLWSASFYFCITTGSTVGYGDIHATNTMERLAGSFLLTCSVLGIGQMIAQVGEVVITFQEQQAETLRLKRNAKTFMRKRHVHRDLYLQVLRYLDGLARHDLLTSFEGSGFMECLSESLQSELRFGIVGQIIKSFPIFSEIHDGFIKSLCQVVESQRAGVGDIIVEEEQSCEAMFMIVSGEFSYGQRDGIGGVLQKLDWFGERALFFDGIVYNMTVTCEVDSELIVLRRKRLMEQLPLFPKVQAEYLAILEALKAGLKPKDRMGLRRGSMRIRTERFEISHSKSDARSSSAEGYQSV